MMRDSQIMAQIEDENLGYMSDMALELAQMADDAGLTTLAYLFRMAALEASTVNSVLAEPDDLPNQMTSHLTHLSLKLQRHSTLPRLAWGRVTVWVRQVAPYHLLALQSRCRPRGAGMQQSACLVSNRTCLGTILPLPIFRP